MKKILIVVFLIYCLYAVVSFFSTIPDGILGVSLGDMFDNNIKLVESSLKINFEINEIDKCEIYAFYENTQERIYYAAVNNRIILMYHIRVYPLNIYPDSMEFRLKTIKQHGLPNGFYGLAGMLSLIINLFSDYNSDSGVMFTYEEEDIVYRVIAKKSENTIEETKRFFSNEMYYSLRRNCSN